MAKEKLLIVDADRRCVCVLEVSLRTAGYGVTTAADGHDALARIESSAPDLVICDTALAKVDGFALARRLKERPEWATIPVIFLTSQKATEDRIRSLDVGVEDCLAKPVFVREVVARVRLLLDRRLLEKLAAGETPAAGGRFAGSTRDVGVVNLLQAFEASRRTGVLKLQSGAERGSLYLRDGRVVDATLASLRGEEAVYRALTWNEATFEIELGPVPNENVIGRSTEVLVMEGMRRELAGRVVPATAPEGPGAEEEELDRWLQDPHAESSAEPPLEHEPVGVPHHVSPAIKRLVLAALAGSAVILLAGSLNALRARQERLAEESRTHAASTEATTVQPIHVPPPPPTASAPASAQGAESDSPGTSAPPMDGAVTESPANPLASAVPTVAGLPSVARAAAAATGVTTSRPVAVTPPAPPSRETPDTKANPGGGSLVVQASRALANGAPAHAVDLARQAIAANPGDADAWLTLAAAYQASGNVGAARASYASCAAQARTPNVSECRVLAGR